MPHRDHAPIGAPCWIELFSSDTAASRAFYSELFGWSAEDPNEEFGGYLNFHKDSDRIAGCMNNDGSSGTPDGWSIYLATADAKATEKSAVEAGAQVFVPAMEVGDLGSMLVMADPGGAAIGAWQSGQHTGFKRLGEPNAPSWFELHTRDYDKSVSFYQKVFGWDTHVASDTDEFRYTTLGEGENQMAGIMDASGFLPDGVPAQWSVYFGTEDTDKALERTVELGGQVILPAEDTPYGRIAQAADPTGAQFKLVCP